MKFTLSLLSTLVAVAVAENGALLEKRQFPGVPIGALGPISAAMGKCLCEEL